jgi:malonate decarboxylase delta subunit
MECFKFRFENGKRKIQHKPHVVGVVSSGNLEILLETTPLDNACEIEVRTSINGYKDVWQAVLNDFHKRWELANVRLFINDVGGTPAIVRLLKRFQGRNWNEKFLRSECSYSRQ